MRIHSDRRKRGAIVTTYIRTHGRHLRWTIAELRRNGIGVQRVEKALGRDFFVIADADEKTVDKALQNLRGYRPRKRKPTALRILDMLMLGGVGAAGVVALVTPLGGAVVLAVLALVRWAFGNMHIHAKELADLGGKWRLYAVLGVMLIMLVVAGFIATAGGMAAMEIADGNSALSLLER